jgi:WD40 repeat protein
MNALSNSRVGSTTSSQLKNESLTFELRKMDTMKKQKRKTLDDFSDESEQFESRFERLVAGNYDESARARLVADIKEWMKQCTEQGRYIPTASAERRAFRSLLERWSSRLRNQGHYVENLNSLADFDPNAGIVLTDDCPYPGLEPYRQNLRGSFFGREALIASFVALLEREGNRILLIIGASGSGKSSLAMAGVLPRLVDRHEGTWLFCPRMTPGAHPLYELSAAVTQAIGRPDRANEIERALAANPNQASRQLATLSHDKPLMLLVDQFEELLTMCRDVHEQNLFAQVLCALSEPTASCNGFSCRILLTLRTDHLARFESNNVLKQLHMRLNNDDNQHYLSAIGFEDIKRAIKRPADEVGLRFIPANLIDQLASQTAGLSNGLPLLQFALCRLWDTRPKNESGEPLDMINAEMVSGLPDVERALGTVADSIFRNFSDAEKRMCERLLLELLVLDESFEEPLRRRRNELEVTRVLEARFPEVGGVVSVIDNFVAAGLLRRFRETTNSQLEVAHEALLRHWDHIYRLLTGAAVKERLHLIKQIGREASDWAVHDSSKDYLSLRGERLDRALAYGADGWLAEAEMTAYVDACRAREDEEKRRNRLAKEEKERAHNMLRLAVSAVLIMVLIFSIGLAWAYYRANKISFARELAMAAEAELDRNSQVSLLLTIEAAKTLNDDLLPEVESAIRSSIRAARVSGLFKSYGMTSFSAAEYTPDGSVLAVGDSLGGVTIWDIATGLQRKALFAHVDNIEAIAFSPDGRSMATGSADGKVVIWDTESATPVHILNSHVDKVTTLAFSRPDGKLLATGGDDASLRIWNVSSGTLVRPPLYGHIGGIRKVAFGRDERQFVTAGQDNRIIMWDGQEGRVLYSFQAHRLFDLDLSTDGSLLAVATDDKVEIWDTATRARRWTLAGHTNSVFHVRFSHNQRRVATAAHDSTVRVWRLPLDDPDPRRNPEELTQIRTEPTPEVQEAVITALAFSPNGDTVAAALHGGTAMIWNVAAGGELLTLNDHETRVEAVAFSPNSETIAAAGGGQVLTWDLSGKRQKVMLKDISSPGRAVAFSKAGAFAIGSHKDVFVILPNATGSTRLEGHGNEVNDLAFSPDGSRLVSGSHDETSIVWDLTNGEKLQELRGHNDWVTAVAYSPDGKTVVTGSRDSTIILWDAETWQPKHNLKEHLLGIVDLAFTSDSKRLVSASVDKTVRIWDVATGKQQAVLAAHSDAVTAVAIYGDQLATGGDDGIRLWDLRSLEPLPVFPTRSHGAHSLAFSSDGRYLAAGAGDGVVRVYAMQGKELIELANKRVHRGWTSEECRLFLRGTICPRSPYSLLEEGSRKLREGDFKDGERLLREARSGGIADAKAIDTEVNSRVGTIFLSAATYAVFNPTQVAQMAKGKGLEASTEEIVLMFLLAAKEKLNDSVLDPQSRGRELNAYQHVQRARSLARQGQLDESIAAFRQARDAGWKMPDQPENMVSQLIGVRVLSLDLESTMYRQKSNQDRRKLTQDAELLLNRFPAFGPGYEVLARIHIAQGDYTTAEKYYLAAAAKGSSAEPLASLAELSFSQYNEQQDINHARSAVMYAKRAIEQDPGSDQAWFYLGHAEHVLKNHNKAVYAFDHVAPYSDFSASALNAAAAIYFEYLGDDQAAYQRLARAAQLAPDDLNVLSNYAEFLLASGRNGQAKLAGGRARAHKEAKRQGEAHVRAAMSFVIFAAELLSGNHDKALAELDEIDKDVNAASAEAEEMGATGKKPQTWEYKGIRRSLKLASHEQRNVLLMVLKFVETNGKNGTLDDMRRWLRSRLAKG